MMCIYIINYSSYDCFYKLTSYIVNYKLMPETLNWNAKSISDYIAIILWVYYTACVVDALYV